MPLYLDQDLLPVYAKQGSRADVMATLLWGDALRVVREDGDWVQLKLGKGADGADYLGWVKGPLRTKDKPPVLKVTFIDVGQGDAAMIETPQGRRILVDAGEEQFLARYLAKTFEDTGRFHLDAIVITHGDADHFKGLPILVNAANLDKKNVVVTCDRVFHNGLVKLANEKGLRTFGATARLDGNDFVTDLFDDPRQVLPKKQNTPYRLWSKALDELEARQKKGGKALNVMRLDANSANAFDFVKGTKIDVLGPVTTTVSGREALPFIERSESKTVNGNSVVLRIQHGAWRFLFTGDLNEASEQALLARNPGALTAEILKVPHHGSADYGSKFLQAVSPLVSVVSTGTTSERKEYLHPRANLMAALGAAGRPVPSSVKNAAEPLVFVTRLAGAFKYVGPSIPLEKKKGAGAAKVPPGTVAVDPAKVFYGLVRDNYGIVHIRCDENRLLITRKGMGAHIEPYAFKAVNGQYLKDSLRGSKRRNDDD
jgi:beta-lactamase superfamily II metal-dependent hydrolase